MTTLYHPVLIESAEQAEALLPVAVLFADLDTDGKIRRAVLPGGLDAADLWENNFWYVGWMALVPIEAEEEWTAMGTDDGEPWIAHVGRDGIDGSRKEAELYVERFGGFIAHRALTPWTPTEEA